MTQYDVHEIDRLEKAKNKWRGTEVNNGVIERKYLNGDTYYLDCKTNKQWKVFKNLPKQTLIDRFRRRNRGHG